MEDDQITRPVMLAQIRALRAALEPLARHDGEPLDVSHLTRAHVKAARQALAFNPQEETMR